MRWEFPQEVASLLLPLARLTKAIPGSEDNRYGPLTLNNTRLWQFMQSTPDNSSIEERIRQVIDDKVRPYIEMDGGGIEFVRYDEGIVYVRLSGACRGCPSSLFTLKQGVEQALCTNIPEVASVEMDDIAPLDQPLAGGLPIFQL